MNENVATVTLLPQPGSELRPRALIRKRVRESIELNQHLMSNALVGVLAELAGQVALAVRSGGKVILFGNGGSSADASHLAAEFVGRFAFDRDPMPALSLSDNVPAMTAIGNDYAYDETFARQIRAFASPGDVAIGLSTSGTSPNVVRGLETARECDMFTALFTGARGSRTAGLVDLAVVVPSYTTARIQESCMLYAHIMCELVERDLFGDRV